MTGRIEYRKFLPLLLLISLAACNAERPTPKDAVGGGVVKVSVSPGDTNCPAECDDPKRSSGDVWCLETPACTKCTPPPGRTGTCGCKLWSRLPIPKPVPDKFDPDWKKEADAGTKVTEDTSRKYFCKCGT
jgi:hypothetical protein